MRTRHLGSCWSQSHIFVADWTKWRLKFRAVFSFRLLTKMSFSDLYLDQTLQHLWSCTILVLHDHDVSSQDSFLPEPDSGTVFKLELNWDIMGLSLWDRLEGSCHCVQMISDNIDLKSTKISHELIPIPLVVDCEFNHWRRGLRGFLVNDLDWLANDQDWIWFLAVICRICDANDSLWLYFDYLL